MGLANSSALTPNKSLRQCTNRGEALACLNMYIYKRVDISILVMGDDSGIKGYDRTKSEQSNAPLLITQDANRVKKK